MSENSESAQDEMKRLLRQIAGRARAGESEAVLQRRAARKMSLPFSRTSNLWYGEARRIDSWEMDRARTLTGTMPIEEAIHAVSAVENRLEALQQGLAAGFLHHLRQLRPGFADSLKGGPLGARVAHEEGQPGSAGDLKFQK